MSTATVTEKKEESTDNSAPTSAQVESKGTRMELSSSLSLPSLSSEFQPIAVSSFRAYVRLTVQSVTELSQRRFVTARLASAESLAPLMEFIFAIHNRTRPSFAEMIDEPHASLLGSVCSSLGEMLQTTMAQLLDGRTTTQVQLFGVMEQLVTAHADSSLRAVLAEFDPKQLQRARPKETNEGNGVARRGGPSDESTLRLIVFINRVHGLKYELLRRLDGGFSCGAFLLRKTEGSGSKSAASTTTNSSAVEETKTTGAAASASGQSNGVNSPDNTPRLVVLKWQNHKGNEKWNPVKQLLATAPLVERAVAAGYPTPRWIAHGVSPSGFPYHVQEFVSNFTTLKKLTVDLVPPMIAALQLQRNFFKPDEESGDGFDWVDQQHSHVFRSSHITECLTTSTSVPGTKELYDRVIQLVEPLRKQEILAEKRALDLVHGDLNSGNVLVEQVATISSPSPEASSSSASASEAIIAVSSSSASSPSDRNSSNNNNNPRIFFVDTECMGHGSMIYDVVVLLLGGDMQQGPKEESDNEKKPLDPAVDLLLEYALRVAREDEALWALHLALAARMFVLLFYALIGGHHPHAAVLVRHFNSILDTIDEKTRK